MSYVIGFVIIAAAIAYFSNISFVYAFVGLVVFTIGLIVLNAIFGMPARNKSLSHKATPVRNFDNKKGYIRDGTWREGPLQPDAIESHGGKARDDLPADGAIHVSNARIGITYRDGFGSVSERCIVPRSLDFRIGRNRRIFVITVDAFCELRHDHRTFKYNRILNAYNADTGEVISNLGQFLWSHEDTI